MGAESPMPAVQRIADLRYAIGGPRSLLIIKGSVLAHFDKHRQRSGSDKESGGQIFASYEPGTITIRQATGPYETDDRSRYRFTPDRSLEKRDLRKWFRKRRHYIGNWHTHPEPVPKPSRIDVKNTRARFIESETQLLAFTMIIVGLAAFPEGLWVSLVDATGHTVLQPAR
jgi:integrative and conjugative element protein (TIGR02256 family)